MKKALFIYFIFSQLIANAQSQTKAENKIPLFFRSQLVDIESQLKTVKNGKVKIIAHSPGGLPLYSVSYGKKNVYYGTANYNSAVGAKNPAFCAIKSDETLPVVYLVGPVHGHEIEGIVGLRNLINIAETGKDLRGKEWPSLKNNFDKCRVVIIPCGNPDGRKRNPIDCFIGLPDSIAKKYGSGTHKDGKIWQYPYTKGLHPMRGDVGILGAYFNNDGVNMMHDDFFAAMANETKAILNIARDEMPDYTAVLHTQFLPPSIWITNFVPVFIKQRIANLTNDLRERSDQLGLPFAKGIPDPNTPDDPTFPPTALFNLASAIHHVSGSTAFVYEITNGAGVQPKSNALPVTYDSLLDMELNLFDIVFEHAVNNRNIWLLDVKK